MNAKFMFVEDGPCDICNSTEQCIRFLDLCGNIALICKNCLENAINEFDK